MMKTICFDFGNTRLKAAIFENDAFKEEIILPNDDPFTIERLLDIHQPDKTILSSVINHNPSIEKQLAERSQFHKLSHLTKANFTIPVGKPETVGADRLALCAAAVYYFPGKNNLVIAMGTCITYNRIISLTSITSLSGEAFHPEWKCALKRCRYLRLNCH